MRSNRLVYLSASALLVPTLFAQVNVLTYRNDNLRTALNAAESVLTPAGVNSAGFGKLFSFTVDGKVDAQPLVVSNLAIPGKGTHNVVFAVTEHDSVFAFDAANGAPLWQVTALKSGETPSDSRGCSQVSPEIGITSTPVIDPAAGPHGTIYLVAMSKDSTGKYHHRLHALDLTTGAEQFGGPMDIQATFPGTGDGSNGTSVVFDPKQYKDRTALTLVNGIVYTTWASHCDIRPYTGWTISYDQFTLQQKAVYNFTPNGNEGAIWGAGGGAAADPAGNVFYSLGNGTFDTTLTASGFPNRGDFGNAFVKLTASGNSLAATDYWTMYNTVAESNIDQDLGSGGVMLLPDLTDSTGTTRHLGVGAGKDKNVYLFDRDNMGKFNPNDNSNLYQQIPGGLNGGEFASPAWFNGYIYFGAVGDVIRAFRLTNAHLGGTPAFTSPTTSAYPGTSPSVSANGTSNAILWSIENGTQAVLHAYDANNLLTELYNSKQAPSNRDQFGAGNKFITPTVVNGRVYVGTPNSVAVFGLLAATLTSVSPSTGVAGTLVNVTLTGSNFAPASTVSISNPNITVGNVNVVSATKITASLTIGSAVAAGAYNVSVASAGGSSNSVPFAVTAAGAKPSITAIAPSAGAPGTVVNVTITGANFISGASLALTGTGVSAGNVSVVSSTQITATLTTAANAVAGVYNLTVTTSAGTSNAIAFSVSQSGGSAPVLNSMTPSSGNRGTSVNVTLTGTGFTPQTGVRLSGIGASFRNVVVVSSTQITVTFVFTTTTATGTHNVYVVNPNGSSNILPFTVN